MAEKVSDDCPPTRSGHREARIKGLARRNNTRRWENIWKRANTWEVFDIRSHRYQDQHHQAAFRLLRAIIL